jgi:hypothetical protein
MDLSQQSPPRSLAKSRVEQDYQDPSSGIALISKHYDEVSTSGESLLPHWSNFFVLRLAVSANLCVEVEVN